MGMSVEFSDVGGGFGGPDEGIYAVVISYGDRGPEFCLKGVELTGKTSSAVASELEFIAKKLKGGAT